VIVRAKGGDMSNRNGARLTRRHFAGYVEGAVRSAEQVADQVLAEL
jgi:hypothetical protein